MKLTQSTWRTRLGERDLQMGDIVVFYPSLHTGERVRVEYTVKGNYMSCEGGNGRVFTILGLNPRLTAHSVYGYLPLEGDFPPFRSYSDLGRLVAHLYGVISERRNSPPPPPLVYDGSNGKYCVACRTFANRLNRRILKSGVEICSDCFTGSGIRRRGMCCSVCNVRFLGNDIFTIDEERAHTLCIYCKRDEGDRSVHQYNFKPSPKFYSTTYIDQKEYLGWELEVEAPGIDVSEISREFRNKHWYFKMDGSLQEGVEIVSHPASFSYLKQKQGTIESLLVGLTDSSCKSESTVTCGMHIHVSKNAISGLQLWKMLDFFRKNKPFIYQMSGRTLRRQLNRYASLGGINKRTQPLMAKKYWDRASKYTAINIRPSQTIEFRIFKGTLNPHKFYKNLEFVDSLVQWTKNESLDRVTIANYCEFVEENKKRYPNVLKYMKDNDMIKRKLKRKSKELTIEM